MEIFLRACIFDSSVPPGFHRSAGGGAAATLVYTSLQFPFP